MSQPMRVIPLQETSKNIWDYKYRLKDQAKNPIDNTVDDTFQRVAGALAAIEPNNHGYWYKEFLWAMRNGAIPAGRILSNAGAHEYKPATSTINCVVSGEIGDSMEDILEKNKEAGVTLKYGCGIGYCFSTIRPRGAYVTGAGAATNGPLGFMDIFDRMCFTVSSAGGRRGAQMATFDVSHPDIMEFIKAKREDGRLRQFNCSVLVTDEFMQAVEDNEEWKLRFPLLNGESEENCETITDPSTGKVCKVHSTVKARDIWNTIMEATHEYAEPGFMLIDRINEQNNNWFCEDIRASNPCGEQPLPPYGSCLLGSINLTQCVEDPFSKHAYFNWEKYKMLIHLFSRMLDNVVEINNLPLEQQRAEIMRKRRHGMGIFGLGSALAMLGARYGSAEGCQFTEQACQMLAVEGMRTGLELAKEKGEAPIMEEKFEITRGSNLYHKTLALGIAEKPWLDEMIDDANGTLSLRGRALWAFSNYMQRIRKVDPMLWQSLAEHGCRYTHATSIAPTGTISLSIGCNASNGIEPTFSHRYYRNVVEEGYKTKRQAAVCSYELLAYQQVNNLSTDCKLPDHFVTADDITPKEHIDMQAAAQKWIDSSISKTVNVPTKIAYEEFKDVYTYAWQQGLKSCATFRYNPAIFQGVLVRDDDLANTTYRFTLADGSVVEAKGNDEIEYDGEVHTAANLYDGLKEGTYGKW